MRTSVDLRFEKGDPVCEYWLARGEGFAVETRRGRVVGHVVDVVVDPDDRHVVSLVVRRTLGTSELPADEINAVVPARDAFVLNGTESPPESARRERPTPRVSPALSAARRRITPVAAGLAAATAAGLRRAGPPLRSAAIVVLAWAVGLSRWAAYFVGLVVTRGRRRLAELLDSRRQ